MARDQCFGLRVWEGQYKRPNWAPLVEAVGELLAGGFMWMHEGKLGDGTPLHAYKHIYTRRYLYLTPDLTAFEPLPCDRFAPLRLDFALERALCTWWTLSGWEPADAEAIRDAILRANHRVTAEP
jgi:hypothetical protein